MFGCLQEGKCNFIVERYVEELIRSDQKALVAHYVAKLPLEAQVHWYSLFLEGQSNTQFTVAEVHWYSLFLEGQSNTQFTVAQVHWYSLFLEGQSNTQFTVAQVHWYSLFLEGQSNTQFTPLLHKYK